MAFRYALAVSPYAESMIERGFTYTDGSCTARSTRELQELYIAHGGTEIGAVIGTQRHAAAGPHTDSSLDAALRRAKLAVELDVPFNPLLFLCRTYADYSGQPSPVFDDSAGIAIDRPWETLTIDEMAKCLRRYGRAVAQEILSTGVRVVIWDLGQEVDIGVAGVTPRPAPYAHFDEFEGGDWYRPPDGVDPDIGRGDIVDLLERPADYIVWLDAYVWPHTARLLAAAAEGIRSVDPDARFTTHLARFDFAFNRAFWRAMSAGGYEPDQLGMSWYPSAYPDTTAAFTKFRDDVRRLTDEVGKPVVLTEYAYPSAPLSGGIFQSWSHEVDGYPLTEEGQARMLQDTLAWGIAEGCLAGVRPFGPDLILEGWQEMTFFRREGDVGVARPALQALETVT
jgi:hypothetical protein